MLRSMTRHYHLSILFCSLLFVGLMVKPSLSAEKRPNLLIISTDEHHFGTLGCYGGKIVDTKNIDELASQGAVCTGFYATTPVCSPSRAALVSGLYPQKTPVVTNNIRLDDSIVTFAEILRRQGYATGYAGKWHLDGVGKPQWAPKRQFGFADNRFMFNRGHWKKFADTPDGPKVGATDKKGNPSYGVDNADEKSFSTDWLSDKAVDFIETNKDKSFCYMLSLPDPHGPNTVRAPYDKMYENVEVPIPTSLMKSRAQTPGRGGKAGVTAAQIRKIMPPYFGMVKCIDDNIGKIVDKLKEHDLLDNTIVVMTSDHGDLCGEHGRLNKGVPYEGSARIPFIIRYPKSVKAGLRVEQALSCIDFLPTVLTMMDVKFDQNTVDGRNASALFSGGKTKDWNDIAFIRSTPGSAWISAVTANYKLVYSSADKPWLLDLKKDPKELENRFDDPQYREMAVNLTRQLLQYTQDHQDVHAREPEIRSAMAETLKTP